MSVPKSKRGHGELETLTKARALRTYTIRICSNEKHFPKRYRWIITNQIVQSVNQIDQLIIMANAVKVDNVSDRCRRIERQKMAYELTESLLDDINCAYELFHIDSDRIAFWTSEIVSLQGMLRNWIRSDKERYANIG